MAKKKKCCRKHFKYNPNCIMCEILNQETLLPSDKELKEMKGYNPFRDL